MYDTTGYPILLPFCNQAQERTNVEDVLRREAIRSVSQSSRDDPVVRTRADSGDKKTEAHERTRETCFGNHSLPTFLFCVMNKTKCTDMPKLCDFCLQRFDIRRRWLDLSSRGPRFDVVQAFKTTIYLAVSRFHIALRPTSRSRVAQQTGPPTAGGPLYHAGYTWSRSGCEIHRRLAISSCYTLLAC